LQDAGVESAEAPGGGRRIGGLDFSLQGSAVDIEGDAGTPRASDLDHGGSGAKLLPDAELPAIEPADSQVLAQSAGIERVAALDELFDALESDEKHGLLGTAVDLGMGMGIAFESERADRSL
jgi:hypothetical protein